MTEIQPIWCYPNDIIMFVDIITVLLSKSLVFWYIGHAPITNLYENYVKKEKAKQM